MKRGGKLSLYVSREVDAALATLRSRVPGATDAALVRRALAALAEHESAEFEVINARHTAARANGVWN
jgi:hypothetical protein